jgi:hypothetical protein
LTSGFLHGSVTPQTPDYTNRAISNFSKIRGDIRNSRCTTGVVYTGGKFAASVVNTGGNLLLASLTLVANLPPVSTTLGKLVEKFATGVVDTGGAP